MLILQRTWARTQNKLLTFYGLIMILIFAFHYATLRWIIEVEDDKGIVVRVTFKCDWLTDDYAMVDISEQSSL